MWLFGLFRQRIPPDPRRAPPTIPRRDERTRTFTRTTPRCAFLQFPITGSLFLPGFGFIYGQYHYYRSFLYRWRLTTYILHVHTVVPYYRLAPVRLWFTGSPKHLILTRSDARHITSTDRLPAILVLHSRCASTPGLPPFRHG